MNYVKFLLILCWMIFQIDLTAQFETFNNPVEKVDSRTYVPYREGKLWGYCDWKGKVVLAPKYEETGFFRGWGHTAAVVKQGGKAGVIDSKFQELIPCKYSSVTLVFCNNGDKSAIVKEGSKTGVIRQDGTVLIPFEYDSVSFKFSNRNLIAVAQKGKWGFYDLDGKLVAKPEFTTIDYAENYEVTQKKDFGVVGISKKRAVYFGYTGKIEEMSSVKEYEKRWLSQADFDARHPDKLLPEQKEELKTKEAELKKEEGISRIRYDRAIGYSEESLRYEYVLAEKAGKVTPVTWRGARLLADYYEDIKGMDFVEDIALGASEPSSYYKILVKKGGKWGVIDEHDAVIVPFEYDDLGKFNGSWVVTHQKGKEGVFFFAKPKNPVPCIYNKVTINDYLDLPSGAYFQVLRVIKNGQVGYVGENGVEYFK